MYTSNLLYLTIPEQTIVSNGGSIIKQVTLSPSQSITLHIFKEKIFIETRAF